MAKIIHWKSMDTAPKNGTEIIGLHLPTGDRWICSWRKFPPGSYADGAWKIKALPGRDPIANIELTHWATLPAVPH